MLIGYACLSTRDQEGSLEGQEAALKAQGCERIFSDVLSGARPDRPGLAAAPDCVRDDAGDVFVVTRLDRLGRLLPATLRMVEDQSERGVGLKALDVDLNSSTAVGKLMMHLFLVLVQWERDLLRKRTLVGVARAGGREPKLSAEQIEAVRAAVASDQPVATVPRSFGISRPTIYKVLESSRDAA